MKSILLTAFITALSGMIRASETKAPARKTKQVFMNKALLFGSFKLNICSLRTYDIFSLSSEFPKINHYDIIFRAS
jgi:hypothetical protein